MLRQEGFLALQQANGVFQVAAERQHSRPAPGQRDRHRDIATGPADKGRPARTTESSQRGDLAIMLQEGIGQAGQPGLRLVVADDQRFAMRIRAGHHQQQVAGGDEPVGAGRTTGRFMPEQQMQRRRRQHDAKPGEAGGNARQLGRRLRTEHDGRRGTVQPTRLRLGQSGRSSGERCGIQRHHRQRLFFALLAPPATRPRHRCCAHRRASWKPPSPLIATILPARSRRRVSPSGSPGSGWPVASSEQSCGPQSGQQVVSAWKRRSGALGGPPSLRNRIFDHARRTERKRRQGWCAPGHDFFRLTV